MRRSAFCVAAALLILAVGRPLLAEETDLESALRFETLQEGAELAGWGGGPAETIHFDGEVVHGGHGAARVERDADASGAFSTITKSIAIDFGGESIELRGYLRTEDVDGGAGLWLREDGTSGGIEFTSMLAERRAVEGTTEWTQYSVRLPMAAQARDLFFGVLLKGTGKVWADDLEILVDGKAISEAPERKVEKTILDTDQEFDGGSGIRISTLTAIQVENVARLGRVWGFLKYHHPRIAAGELHWDYELFRVLPAVLKAADLDAGNRVLARWVEKLGVPESCEVCAKPPENAQLLSHLDWIEDADLLGPELPGLLKKIHAFRYAGDEPFYVRFAGGAGNPYFDHDLPYPRQRPPDAGYRILALLRLWNIIEYWFPYRDQLDDDWRTVLREHLPRLVEAADWDAYRLALLAVVAKVRDTHANLWSELDVRPPRGECRWPVALRFVEGRATVAEILEAETSPDLEIGDVVETVDGRPVRELIEEWTPYYAASNEARRFADIARFLTRGPCGASTLGVERRGEPKTVPGERLAGMEEKTAFHDRSGETFQRLSEDVGYLKLSSVRIQDIDRYLEQASGTRGLVIDIRNYPSEFVVFALGSRLVDEPTPFTRFTLGDLANPGAFLWTPPLTLKPEKPGYAGRVAILVDEVSISQAEYTAMALRAGPRAVVVGSTTAGADGNVSQIPLPGGVTTMISGLGVFYPDKTPTQRVGIVPDIVVAPTIEGIREGRDEVLEEALRHLLGPNADPVAVRKMAHR